MTARLFFGIILLFSLCRTSSSLGGEIPIDLSKAPLVYKDEATVASSEPSADGSGARLNYDFENGGTTVRYEFVISPPIDQPISKIMVTGKGKDGPGFLLVRDASKQSVAYKFGPLTEDEQTFTVDMASPAFPGAAKKNIEYPITAICFTIKKPAEPKGSFDISKITAESSE